MTRDEILAAFDRMRVWQQGDRRAPHKPLLILFELGRLAAGGAASIDYNDAEPKLIELLDEFGPDGSSRNRHNPFWHLQTDKLWQLEGPERILQRPPGATPNIGELREGHVRGGFPLEIRVALEQDPDLAAIIAARIVAAHFPESIRQEVLEAVGLGGVVVGESIRRSDARRRDPAFREKVLLAYEYRCCVCGHDLRLGRHVIGLEAAHIKWFQANGPDVETNGLCLCSLHHKIFDLGAFTVIPETLEIVFSRHAIASAETQGRLLAHHGASLILPQSHRFVPVPDPAFLGWHRKEVFKEPARSY